MEQRNLLLAMALCIGILFGWNILFPPPPPVQQETAETAGAGAPGAPGDVSVPSAPSGSAETAGGGAPPAAVQTTLSREEALAASPRVAVSTDRLAGSIALKGGRIDDLTLNTYRKTIDPTSPPIRLLSPSQGPDAYFAEFGWIAAPGAPEGSVPGADTLWEASSGRLTAGSDVTLTWRNGQGLVFERKISLDDGYMFTVEDSVRNEGEAATTLWPYGLVSRAGLPEVSKLFVLYEGPIGYVGGSVKEVAYKDLMEDGAKGVVEQSTTGGWIGMTEVYWLAAIIPDPQLPVKARFMHRAPDGKDLFQTDYAAEAGLTVAPGGAASFTHRFFGGAKEVKLLDRYEEQLGVPEFHRSIDFGWFHFLTRPFFYALSWLHDLIGNMGLAIMALTVCIKLLFFPLANKSYKSMSQMKGLQPEMMKLRERYGDDRQKLNQEMMALYKEKKVNPAAGCLPILIQIPVFFSLYKVLIVTIEMRHAPFFGWIRDLSAPDPTSVWNLFGLLPYDPSTFVPHVLNIGAWAIAMGITMFMQQRLNPQPTDPVQAKVFAFMPLIFTFLLATFASGLVIYWTWNNLLSIAQQAVIMKRQGVPIGRRAQARAEKAGEKA